MAIRPYPACSRKVSSASNSAPAWTMTAAGAAETISMDVRCRVVSTSTTRVSTQVDACATVSGDQLCIQASGMGPNSQFPRACQRV